MYKHRQLQDLISIGPAMLRDFERLGIRSVPQARKATSQENVRAPAALNRAAPGYLRLGRFRGRRRPGAQSAPSRRALPVVVLEQEAEEEVRTAIFGDSSLVEREFFIS